MPTATPEQSRHRLTVLANFLDTLPEKAYDLNSWITPTEENPSPESLFAEVDGNEFRLKINASPQAMIDCGTTACACGWAATIPEFAAAGFWLFNDGEDTHGYVRYDNSIGIEAAGKFFGLDDDDAMKLFFKSHYEEEVLGPKPDLDRVPVDDDGEPLYDVPPSMVAKRIREFVATRTA